MVYKQSEHPKRRVKEQLLLFSETTFYPAALPCRDELQPASHLAALFDECHNYIYANEGLLKEKIFHEMVKLLAMKLYDEQNSGDELQFGITASEYKSLQANEFARRTSRCAFEERLAWLSHAVSQQYHGLLRDEPFWLKPLTLAYIVGRLQLFSLRETPGDMKGEAFQTFIYRHQRGDRGEFFTPHPVVKLAVEMLAPQPNERVIDPACGSGGFLVQTIAYLRRTCPGLDVSAYVQEHVQGIEFNPDVALSASIRMKFEGGDGSEILYENALENHPQLDGTYDVILTNPPFGSKGKVDDPQFLKNYVLARKWQPASDRRKGTSGAWKPTQTVLPGQSPEILFIEKCLKLLRPGGRMAIVLPDGLLQNVTNIYLRYWIGIQTRVLGVVSIPQEAFIPYGTGIKTSLLLLQKLPATEQTACFMARIQKIGYDVKGQPVYKRNQNGKTMKSGAEEQVIDDDIGEIAAAYRQFQAGEFPNSTGIFHVPYALLNSRLDVEHYHPEDQKMLKHLITSGAKPLSEIAEILKETDDFRTALEDEFRYISISDVDGRTMQVVSQQVLHPSDAPSRATYRVRTGDIITAVSGASTGTFRQASALITEDEDGAICTNGFAVIRNVHGVDPLFLLAYMRTDYYFRQVRRLMTGHAIPAISLDDLAKVLIPVPPQEQEQSIARAVLTMLDMRRQTMKAGERIVEQTRSLVEGFNF